MTKDMTKEPGNGVKKAVEGARDSSEPIGISIAGLTAWYIAEQGIPMPPELIAALSAALGAIAGRLRQRLGDLRT